MLPVSAPPPAPNHAPAISSLYALIQLEPARAAAAIDHAFRATPGGATYAQVAPHFQVTVRTLHRLVRLLEAKGYAGVLTFPRHAGAAAPGPGALPLEQLAGALAALAATVRQHPGLLSEDARRALGAPPRATWISIVRNALALNLVKTQGVKRYTRFYPVPTSAQTADTQTADTQTNRIVAP